MPSIRTNRVQALDQASPKTLRPLRWFSFVSILVAALWIAPRTNAVDDAGQEPLKLQSEAAATGNDMAPALDTETQRRVLTFLLVFAGFNALWSAAPGSWMGELASGIRGPVVDNLFLPMDLRRRDGRTEGLVRGYLRRLTKRRAWLFTETRFKRGDHLTIRLQQETPGLAVPRAIPAVVRLAKKVPGPGPSWYHVEVRLERRADGSRQPLGEPSEFGELLGSLAGFAHQ